ncbi:MAG: hypothetical protein OXI80_21385 [Caldilineaceae bacterium]|nr:hypothetical protein [Caldilineaceae bacterium]MDE0340239.1 hypothetical protein [Caldilineaceae bacterium]
MNDLPSPETTDDFPTLEDALAQLNSQSQPCERQPGEPLERYRWFQIYVTLPPPRPYKRVAQIAGLRPNTRLIAKASRQWRWNERIADADLPQNGFPALQKEWRAQLLRETAYKAHFTGLAETSSALAGAAIDKLAPAAARRNLGPLFQYQRALLSLTEPRHTQNVAPKISEKRLHNMVLDRRLVIADKLVRMQMEAVLGPIEWEYDPIIDGPKHQSEENLSQAEPWRQQPDESDRHFYWFQIYLSLYFLQSTARVAGMAGIRRKSTLARIAGKWEWQERAAAFDARSANDPLARIQLRLHLLHDRAFEAHLSGVLDATSAIETAAIGSMDRAKARRNLSPLLRRQRSFLQSFWRQYEAVEGKSADEHRDLLLASLVEEKAIQGLREREEDEREIEILRRIYGSEDDK